MQKPLCVDLDGTLILTDSLHEALLLLLKKNIFLVFYSFLILASYGKPRFKEFIATHMRVNPKYLPYNKKFIEWLKEEKKSGRKIFLVTAAHEKIARPISEFLGFFDDIFATTDYLNLKGKNKAKFLNDKFGQYQYDYAGDHAADLNVWENSSEGIIVNATDSVLAQAKKIGKANRVFIKEKLTLRVFFKAIRVHQYVKNLLIFAPLFIASQIFSIHLYVQAFFAFLAFSLLASSVYLLNDLLDLSADRQHAKKSKRALASGQLSILAGFLVAALFFLLSWVIADFLPWQFRIILAGYYLLTIGYSFYLKSLVLFDVFLLAILYTIRVLAGMVFVEHGYSEWLLQFSIFIFLSLAFVKRYAELYDKKQCGELKATGRGYHIDNLPIILVFGVASGYMAALIMALYLNSSTALLHYIHPEFLWLVCPILVYWISRAWLLTTEGKMNDDPIVFALKDRVSYIIVCFIALSGMLAKIHFA